MSQRKEIFLLDEHLINKIAAGEVIEDAASIVKELIENAIDAKATSIEITTNGAGRSLIRIADNGEGIEKEDMPLALYRHATSKIRNIEDLFSVQTFGFRGEALASIASVSKCSLTSATFGKTGYQLSSDGGRMAEIITHPRQKGTTVEVRDLFFNVPVRKKFQKSSASALRDINKVIVQMALAYPEISLKWIADGHINLHLEAGRTLFSSISQLFGEECENNFFMIESSSDSFKIEGGLSVPYFSKVNRSGQYLFINGRPIVSQLISDAVTEAYGTRISEGRFPQFVLFLTLPCHHVDVNVHPQKKEIRFHQENEIYHFVKNAVQKALEKRHAPPVSLPHVDFVSPPIKLPVSSLTFSSPEIKEEIKKVSFSVLALVDQLIIIEKDNLHFLVHTSAAQRRVFFEKTKQDDAIALQPLLFPITIELNKERADAYFRNLSLFQKMKIEMHAIGKDAYMIDSMPEGIDADHIGDLLDKIDHEKEEKKIAFSIGSLLKRKKLNYHEAYKLVETLFECQQYSICPEGKATMIPWPRVEIERLFL